MPEGDTIFRTAVRLRQTLQGREILAASAPRGGLPVDSLVHRSCAVVEARGKHLLLHLDDGRTLHSHMGMTGSWHIYGREEAWQKPAARAAISLETDQYCFVCFTPKLLELLSEDQLRRHPWLQKLGPDLLADPFPEQEALRRLRRHDSAPLGTAIMNQSVVSGIGNVYKSECLFLEQLDPFSTVSQCDDQQLLDLLRRARTLMLRNVQGGPRQTRFEHGDANRLWVYGRQGERCLRCGERIQVRRQGDLGRTTYWCRGCQPPHPSTSR